MGRVHLGHGRCTYGKVVQSIFGTLGTNDRAYPLPIRKLPGSSVKRFELASFSMARTLIILSLGFFH